MSSASPQQAPNSRVVLDLPAGYTPSPLFSGFQNDASGVSFIILEAPVAEYDKMAQGFTAEELAKRGITDVQKVDLARTDPHVYMRAHQKSAAGDYAKFFVLFRTADQTILVSVNVPQRSIEDGSVKMEDIEKVLASAKTTEKAAVRDLYSLGYLGPFKEAGTLVGTSKVYTLDGRLEPERAGDNAVGVHGGAIPRQSARSTTPRSNRRPCLPACLAIGISRPARPSRSASPASMGSSSSAQAVDTDDNVPVHLYQALLLGKDGGYFRLIGIATDADKARLPAEFEKIARSFTLLP